MKTKLVLILLLCNGLTGFSQTGNPGRKKVVDIYEIARSKDIVLPALPWHLMNIHWNYADSIVDFQRMDMDITIDKDIPDIYSLYISPFNGTFNGQTFYAGIQTRIDGSPTKEDLSVFVRGKKGGIFSRWSKDRVTPIGVEYVDMFEGGLCASLETEGAFCSVRRPYEWTKGAYTISLVKEETILFKDEPHTWVCLTVTDKKDSTVTRIGRLLFSGEKLYWRYQNTAFVEIYGFDDKARHIPEAKITFGRPKIGNEPIPLIQLVARQPVSDNRDTRMNTNTPNCAYITSEGTDVTVHITSDVREQTKNQIYQVIMPNGMRAY